MQLKLLEIRDRGTFIPMFALSTESDSDVEAFLLRRAGYGPGGGCILLGRLDGDHKLSYDPYNWAGSRTYHFAHQYIEEHWESIKSGDVIDVEYLLGETPEKKLSEAVTCGE